MTGPSSSRTPRARRPRSSSVPTPRPIESPTAALEAGCFRQVEFAGILRGTDQPELAAALIDHLLAPETQAELPLAMYVYPARSDVALPEVFDAPRPSPGGTPEPGPGGPSRRAARPGSREWTDIVLR